MLCLACAPGCTEDKVEAVSGPVAIIDTTDSQALTPEDPPAPAETEAEQVAPVLSDEELPATIATEGPKKFARATGKARKGRDVSLARQAAANRARRNLVKLLKKEGYSLQPPGVLREATIERVYTRGKFVYAECVLALPDEPGALNETLNDPAAVPSKSTKEDIP